MLLVTTAVAQQRASRTERAALPPLVMTCPTHAEVIESRPGRCPVCSLTLVPVRLDGAWMCPVHSAVMEPNAGTCRVCRRNLIRVTVALTWACRAEGVEHLEPGTCSDGSPRIARKTLRPHGNHNPKHGGQFFMAPDNWHHLEGTYPRAGTFRLYVYDDYARPLAREEMRQVQARVVTEETFDPASRETREVKAFPLRAAGGGAYLEARIDRTPPPIELTAKVRLQSGTPEYRFDFTFTAITREPAAPSPAAGARAAAPPAVPPSAPVEPGPLDPLPVPLAMDDMLRQLQMRTRHVRALIDQGNFAAVYVPAFQAKELAVALEPHLSHLAPEQREAAAPALTAVVRAAWLLDAFGDVGNREQVDKAFDELSTAVTAVVSAFGGKP
jgi:hypothetical protein